MTTTLQKTIYYPDRLNEIFTLIEDSYLASNNGRENVDDGFMLFMGLLRNSISTNIRHHYLYEHIKVHAETIRTLLGRNCNEKAFEAVAKMFDFYGRSY